jgi:regulator of replication initiation timing
MKPLTLKLKTMENRAQELLSEIRSVKSQVEMLETENEKLRRQLQQVYHGRANEAGDEGGAAGMVTGRQNLVNLYQAGFHVCNIQFGQTRADECLFCAAFLRRER